MFSARARIPFVSKALTSGVESSIMGVGSPEVIVFNNKNLQFAHLRSLSERSGQRQSLRRVVLKITPLFIVPVANIAITETNGCTSLFLVL